MTTAVIGVEVERREDGSIDVLVDGSHWQMPRWLVAAAERAIADEEAADARVRSEQAADLASSGRDDERPYR